MRASDQEINELFKRYVARPVMVIVDVREETVGIPTDAYFAVEEIKDVSLDRTSGTRNCSDIWPGSGWYRNTKNFPSRSVSYRS